MALCLVWGFCWFGFQPLSARASSSTALLQLQLGVPGSAHSAVVPWSSVYLGKVRSSAVTLQGLRGAQDSRVTSRQLNIQRILPRWQCCLSALHTMLCSLFVSFKACFLPSSVPWVSCSATWTISCDVMQRQGLGMEM